MTIITRLYQRYLRSREHPAKLRIEQWLGRMLLPAEGGTFYVHRSVKLHLHPRDWIEYRLIKNGKYEAETLDFLAANLREGQSALFAGVNFGLHVIIASRAVGATGRVIGVEPQPRSMCRARRNIEINQLMPNVSLVGAALGCRRGFAKMEDAPLENSGLANMRTASSTAPFEVAIFPVGELCAEVGVSIPDLFLLDVEGFEMEVLKGFDAQFRPAIMVIEVVDDFLQSMGGSAAALFDLVGGMGYELFDLCGKPVKAGAVLRESNLVAVKAGSTTPRFVSSVREPS